ncbi:MAG: metal-sensitive transcriptional regulator [Bacteriovorax sp.]|nr:metal-sensitive transcriptional regulator [Bacteriovorax sp.]
MKSKKVSTIIKSVESHNHPDHRIHLKQLARVKGQVEGIEKMILESRYCIDIINQLKAVSAGLKVIESAIFEGHLKSCVAAALASNDNEDIQKKINEINKLVYGTKSKR